MEYEDDEEEGSPLNELGGLSPLPSTPEATSLLVQTNPAELVAELEQIFAGKIWIAKDKEWKLKHTPLLNDKGINKIMIILKGVVNTNTILSELNEKEIANIIIDIGSEVSDHLAMKYEEYQVDKANLTTIVNLCCRMCYFALKRALNEGERKFLKTSVRSSELIQFKPDQSERRDTHPFLKMFR